MNKIRYVIIFCNDEVYTGGSEGSVNGWPTHSPLQPPIAHYSALDTGTRVKQNINGISKNFSYRL